MQISDSKPAETRTAVIRTSSIPPFLTAVKIRKVEKSFKRALMLLHRKI
jgi:hypothetical protein